jgi:hypothetical protein
MSRLAVFAYASLVSPASAGETLGRTIDGLVPARLEGFSRGWTLGRDNLRSEKTFARADGSLPRFCLGLNLERADERPRPPNGALVEVTKAELERLDVREIRYRRIDVTEAIVADCPDDTYDTVLAYTARPTHHHPTAPGDAIVIGTYLRTVEAAFAALGPEQLDLFRATTVSPPVEVVDATLVRDEIPEGNPRAW